MSNNSKPGPRSPQNCIRIAVDKWLGSVQINNATSEDELPSRRQKLVQQAPKRFTVYEPMLLLPQGSFTNDIWSRELDRQNEGSRKLLWQLILEGVSKLGKNQLTHLAINEGIPLNRQGKEEEDNILRSPSGMRLLYGDFGSDIAKDDDPTEEDLRQAFWVSTKQNGITQTWAPTRTMFSRGNIKEKARLLDFARAKNDEWAVDLYAGIGYFAFSYAMLGFRVLCWELNPWSVEGLRRGAELNRWSVKIVQGSQLDLPVEDLIAGDERIIVFLENNQAALGRIRQLQERQDGGTSLGRIVHVNCGYLPSSQPTWRPAWAMSHRSPEAWLHLHDNVGVADVDDRRRKIQSMLDEWMSADENKSRIAKVSHVEYVKTFAPGVWHCVYDVHILNNDA